MKTLNNFFPSTARASFMALAIICLNFGCGITLFSGKPETAKSGQKKSGANGSTDDEKASDPQVVTGSYLVCEAAPSDKATANSKATIGCSILYKEKVVTPDDVNTIQITQSEAPTTTSLAALALHTAPTTNAGGSFSSLTPTGEIDPVSFDPTHRPQAKFSLDDSTTQADPKIFHGRILDKSSVVVKEFSCNSGNLPCKDLGTIAGYSLTVDLAPIGFWQPESVASQTASISLLKPGCPVNPALSCEAPGVLSTQSPANGMSKDQKVACLDAAQGFLGSISVLFTGKMDPFQIASKPPKALSKKTIHKQTECVVKKISVTNTATPSLVNKAPNGCSVVVVKSIASNSAALFIFDTKTLPPDFEAQLAKFECPQ